MKTIVGLCTCVVLVAACADNPPPREPSSVTNTTSTQTTGNSSPAQPYAQRTPTTVQPSPMNESPEMGATSSARTGDSLAPRGTMSSDGATTTSTTTAVNDKDADNTKKNERDRYGTLTPGNQGNSSSETKITADIRKGLMSSKSLSFTAKNAKVITVGSKVTLRGVVKTDAEKAEIESVAKSTPGVGEVDNQLEVKK